MSTKKRRAVSILCIVLVLALMFSLIISVIGGAYAAGQSQINALKNQRSAISAQKEAIKDKMSGLESDVSTYTAKKVALDEQNELARQEIELINEQIDLYQKLVEEKEQELIEAEKKVVEQAEALRVRMRAMEENSNLSYLYILFDASSFTDFLSRLGDIQSLMERDRALEEAYVEAKENVERVKAEYEETLEQQMYAKVELEQKQAELVGQIIAAEAVIAQLESDLESYKAEYDANAAEEAAIGNQINQLEAQLQEQSSNNGTTPTTGSGTYMWPVVGTGTGSVSSYFGNRVHPIFGDSRFHAGIDISAGSGTTIVAADSGTVLTAVYSSSYGNYVVVSHGNGSTTLSAHMSSMAVSAGQTVSKGQTIGYVGSTGWSTGPHCHYEIRVNGSLVNPLNYY